MIRSNEYRPYLLARINGDISPEAKRLAAISDYDYMGSSEFEFGSIGLSLSRLRLSALKFSRRSEADQELVIRSAPEGFNLTATNGAYAGMNLHALASVETFERYGDSLWQGVRDIIDGKRRCKEWTTLDHSFKKSEMSGDMHFEAWHDIDHQIFFSFSEAYLLVVKSFLSLSLETLNKSDFANYFRIGDTAQGVEPRLGLHRNKSSSNYYHCSVEKWRVVEGKVAGVSDDHLTLKNHGKTYRIPWCLVLTYPEGMPKPTITDDLAKCAKSRY